MDEQRAKVVALQTVISKCEQYKAEALRDAAPDERGEFAAYHRGRADGLKEAAAFCRGMLGMADWPGSKIEGGKVPR